MDLKGKKGRQRSSLKNVDQEVLYPQPLPVSQLKKKDMLDLLKYIPPIHHAFFQNLNVEVELEGDFNAGYLSDYEILDEINIEANPQQ